MGGFQFGFPLKQPKKGSLKKMLAFSKSAEDGFHVVLHNLSPQQEKFRLKVKVTSDHKTADFQLDSHRHTILKLPEGSSLQVETELEKEHCSPLKASAALDAKTLAENGSNVYFWTPGRRARFFLEGKNATSTERWLLWMDAIRSHRFETMVEAFFGWCL